MTDDFDDATVTPWPDVPRIAFGSGPEWKANACASWAHETRERAMDGYITGYSEAASGLLAWVRDTNRSPDYVLWPIAFLWRHHLELALKRIIASGHRLHGERWTFPAGHGLRRLWKEARPFIEELDADATALANVAATIDEIEALDPTATGFRYPIEKDQTTASLKAVSQQVNLALLDEAMRAVAAFLDATHSVQSTRQHYIDETESEMQSFYESERESWAHDE